MKDWVVVLQPNGVVEAVENGAPSTWVGHDLAAIVEAVPLRKTFTHVNDLMVRLLDVFASQAKSSSVQFSVRQEGGTVVSLDREKIAWALATLVGNALRYVRTAPKPRIEVVFKLDETRDELVAVVSDNGPGMPAQRAKWLFSLDPTTGASAGLGLLMVRDVVVAHRGTIEVETAPGKGTAFTIRLPRGTS
jgi:signal transduction histidine kinase